MALIDPIQMNMDISRNIYEGKSNNFFISTAYKIATYTLIPLALVAMFEAVVKNLIVFNALNLAITIVNQVHSLFFEGRSVEVVAATPPPAVPPPPVAAPTRLPSRWQTALTAVKAAMPTFLRRGSRSAGSTA